MATIDRRGLTVGDASPAVGSSDPSANLAIKTPVRVATTANITLNGLQTIDGVALAANDRVLVWNQTDATQNGIYLASSGNWTRTTDFDSVREVVKGTLVYINEGTLYGAKTSNVTASDPIAPDTTSLTFSTPTAPQPLDSDLTAIAALTPSNDDIVQRKSGAWTNRTVAQYGADLASGLAIREKLTANRTYYVRTDGSNSNTGLANTAGGAFLTIQKAINVVAQNIDLTGYAVVIQVADGTYTENLSLARFVGQGTLGQATVTINGNSGTPGNVVIQPASGVAITAVEAGPCWTFANLQINAPSSTCCLADVNSFVCFDNCEFGAATLHCQAIYGGKIEFVTTGSKIVGDAFAHVYADYGGHILWQPGLTVGHTGSRAFTIFAVASSQGLINATGVTFADAGTAYTGARWSASSEARIVVTGGDAQLDTVLPGNANGAYDPMSIARGGTGGTTAAAARTALGLAIGTDVQAYDADLGALSANSTDGFWAHTGSGTGAARTLAAPAAGLTISNPAGIAGNPTFALANDLAALEGLSSNGMIARTATDTAAVRTITGTANEITIANGDGVSGNPTASLPSALTFTGKEVTGGTFASGVFKGTWTASGTWTIPAVTLNGTISGGGNQINNVVIGASSALAGTFTTLTATSLSSTINANGANVGVTIRNNSSGTAADSVFRLTNDAGNFGQFGFTSTGYTTYGPLLANGGYVYVSATGGYGVMIDNGAGTIRFAAGSAASAQVTVENGGNLLLATSLQLPSYTVATLPTGATGKSVWASNCRVFNGAGTQEGAGAGTGGLVTYNGSAWKIAGTNITAVA